MAALVAQQFDQQIRGAVDHLRLVGEIACGIDEPGQLDHPLQTPKIAIAGGPHLRQQRERTALRGGGALFNSQRLAQFAANGPLRIGRDLA